ncbi:TrgA family protein [Frigidibacter oleivorans]|uniref:TrgA family protein n=1 Tax=Frigidibacter oleivorans TaxID=2487129 RepID=UPI000F8F7DC2|nr:TrgA family protein [Frigidibacter oleivorans]
MPTAAKLLAALYLGLVCFAGALAVGSHLPEGADPGWLWAVATGAGLFCGWRVLGPDAGRGSVAAVAAGLRATTLAVLATLFLGAFAAMIQRSMRKLYDGPVEALQDVFRLMLDDARLLLHSDVGGVLIAGAMLAGLGAAHAARTWR